MPDEELVKIFGKNMLENKEYLELFKGLVYQDYDKPFECVGTKAEINLALYTAAEKRKNGELPLLLKEYIESSNETPEPLNDFFDENNFVPKEFIPLLKE